MRDTQRERLEMGNLSDSRGPFLSPWIQNEFRYKLFKTAGPRGRLHGWRIGQASLFHRRAPPFTLHQPFSASILQYVHAAPRQHLHPAGCKNPSLPPALSPPLSPFLTPSSRSLSLSLSLSLFLSFYPPYGRPRCSCSHGRPCCSCCQILGRSARCWLLLAPMLLPGSFGTLVRRKRNCPPRSSRRFIAYGRLSSDELPPPATLDESVFLQEYR